MRHYMIMSRFSPDAFKDPTELPKMADVVSRTVRERCPKVRWISSYASLGRYDVIDIVESDDPREVERAVMLIHGLGRCTTDTLPLTPWKDFLSNLQR